MYGHIKDSDALLQRMRWGHRLPDATESSEVPCDSCQAAPYKTRNLIGCDHYHHPRIHAYTHARARTHWSIPAHMPSPITGAYESTEGEEGEIDTVEFIKR
jgi:hypothetical protein